MVDGGLLDKNYLLCEIKPVFGKREREGGREEEREEEREGEREGEREEKDYGAT